MPKPDPLDVHLLHPPEPDLLAFLQTALSPEIRLSLGQPLLDPPDFQVLVAGRPQREHLEASPRLELLIIPWAGLPPETAVLLREFPHLKVHNLHHNAASAAEMALALLLAAAKFLLPSDRALRRGDWRPRYGPKRAVFLEGKTALVLGYGAVGRRLAKMCLAIGMRVVATRRSLDLPEADGPVIVHPPSALPDLLPQAAVLLVCLPLTDETSGLIGAPELESLPAGAVLVNIGRAAVVAEQALYEALASGRLHAAGLDVWYNYPSDELAREDTLPSAYPFQDLENVVLSPHLGGLPGLAEIEHQRMQALADLLNAARRGEALDNPVDIHRGY